MTSVGYSSGGPCRADSLTNGNLLAAGLVIELEGHDQLHQCILQGPDEERAPPVHKPSRARLHSSSPHRSLASRAMRHTHWV